MNNDNNDNTTTNNNTNNNNNNFFYRIVGSGGIESRESGTTLAQLREALDLGQYLAKVNGQAAAEEYILRGDDFVVFSQAVKGGC